MNYRPPYTRSEQLGLVLFAALCLAILIIAGIAIGTASGQAPQQRGPLGGAPSAGEIELGRTLFFDPLLSQNGTVSCSTCHQPSKGWTDGETVAIGIGGQAGTRNTPTALGSSYMPTVFWDGRTTGFEAQALLPLENPIEMGQQQTADVVRRLRANPGYVRRFIDVFGDANSIVDDVKVSRALSAFESTLVTFDAPIDRYIAGDRDALTADAKIGLQLFRAANCTSCHKPPHYTDNLFHNDGQELASRGVLRTDGTITTVDQGRFAVAPANRRTADMRRAFKTPTLREIHRTAPYGHNGRFVDLKRVVQHKNAGGAARFANGQLYRDPNIDPRMKAQGWTEEQENYVVSFLSEAFAGADYPLVEAPALPGR